MKKNIRKALLKMRSEVFNPEEKTALLSARLTELLTFVRQTDSVGFYWPIKGEPDLRSALLSWCGRTGASLALPVVEGKGMRYRRWDAGTEMTADAAGICCPEEAAEALSPSVIIVPCVGYAEEGFRLGYGGGYFDRYLAESTRRPVAVGVAFDALKVEASVFEPFDQKLDFVVTEARVICVKER